VSDGVGVPPAGVEDCADLPSISAWRGSQIDPIPPRIPPHHGASGHDRIQNIAVIIACHSVFQTSVLSHSVVVPMDVERVSVAIKDAARTAPLPRPELR
jgi:hypothetical protein